MLSTGAINHIEDRRHFQPLLNNDKLPRYSYSAVCLLTLLLLLCSIIYFAILIYTFPEYVYVCGGHKNCCHSKERKKTRHFVYHISEGTVKEIERVLSISKRGNFV